MADCEEPAVAAATSSSEGLSGFGEMPTFGVVPAVGTELEVLVVRSKREFSMALSAFSMDEAPSAESRGSVGFPGAFAGRDPSEGSAGLFLPLTLTPASE